MKRLIVVLSGLLVLPAFAEVAPAYYYDDTIEYSDTDIDVDADDVIADDAENASQDNNTTKTSAPTVTSRGVTNTSPRAASVSPRATGTSRATTARNNATASRTVTARTATTTASRAGTTRAGVSRAAATSSANKTVSARRATSNTTAARASIVQSDTVNTPLYTGRVGVRSQSVTTRVPTVRMAATSTTSADTSTSTTSTTDMDELAQVTDFCKAQYQSCMDNFCNVLDDNQGRCSCSKNLKNYEKTETALKQATEDLQDVAQKIQYIGLSSDEVETLFTQTAAELQMQSSSDNSQLKSDLDKIKSLIVDVKSGTATSTDSGLSFDLSGLLDFTVSSTGFDLSSFLGTNNNTSSISNQRGEQLYKTASARCKASVLNTCSAQGVDISVITNAYDLEIDKQCIAYERALTDSNDQMASTVRNAKSVLQKARLLVAQQKNTYDLRGCINALDSCMQDDFVCGSDYENCLDPTGKYIVDGKIVVGSTPGQSVSSTSSIGAPKYYTNELYATWNYDTDKSKNAWNSTGSLAGYIDDTVTTTSAQSNSDNMSKFLQYKIGYHNDSDGKNYGMCMSVLNKCQDVTYEGAGQNTKYVPKNNVIKEYLQRTLTQIKAKQDELLADYAETCISDVSSCLGQNGYSTSSTTSSSDTAKTIATNACRATIVTCMSVTGDVTGTPDPAEITNWVTQVVEKKSTGSSGSTGGSSSGGDSGSAGGDSGISGGGTNTPGTGQIALPSQYDNCSDCHAHNYTWNGRSCQKKVDFSTKTSLGACDLAGGEWVAKGTCSLTVKAESQLRLDEASGTCMGSIQGTFTVDSASELTGTCVINNIDSDACNSASDKLESVPVTVTGGGFTAGTSGQCTEKACS